MTDTVHIIKSQKEFATYTKTSLSADMRKVLNMASQAADQTGAVLLLGERGTGKNYLAGWIHRQSNRADGPFFTINCATLSKDLAESELFGHEPGSFAKTSGRKKGLLELANEGTLLLKEIGTLDLSIQLKLLSFMNTQSFLRVGGEKIISAKARILAATDRNLNQLVKSGQFNENLYNKLNILTIKLPPLRDRQEDIPALVDNILVRLTVDLGLTVPPALTPNALKILQTYSWPGNVRELRNVLERSIILAKNHEIHAKDLPIAPAPTKKWQYTISFPNGQSLHDITKDVARHIVIEALQRTTTKQNAAEILGITRHALAHQIKILGIRQ